ncbi:NADAR domain-containing protein [Okeania sp. SIO1H2]|uniref:NADAR domain-containing protein n=1 Tax=Okeania sp. SIO1H2 TaxID=2607775 RepID=UPI00141D437F|nr:NADAR domain-containing protein [Okeania sp. SIO1H2]NET97589.1 DUF1768 domain-containing protein [Okeania sp. SIO1H2]
MEPRQQRETSPVKLMFKVIQFLHHLSVCSPDPPKAFKKKTAELNRLVRAADPTPEFTARVQEINQCWAGSVTEALKKHYTARLEVIKSKLENLKLSDADWASSKSKSLQWARRNFGNKLHQNTINQFNHFLLDLPVKNTNPIPTINQPSSKIQNQSPPKTQVRNVLGPKDILSNFYLCKIKFEGVIYRSAEHAYQFIKCEFFHRNKLAEIAKNKQTAAQAKACVGGLGRNNSGWQNYKKGLMERILIAKFDSVPEFRDALKETGTRRLRHPVPDPYWGCGSDGNGQDLLSSLLMHLRQSKFSTPQQPSTSQSNSSSGPTTPLNSGSKRVRSVSPPNPSPSTSQGCKRPRTSNTPPASVPGTTLRMLHTTYPIGSRGATAWRLPMPRRNIFIIGDSNLSRISDRGQTNVQIESYPGMKLSDLIAMLKKFTPSPTGFHPKAIVLSVGLNDRVNAFNTIRINIDKAIRAAKATFPNSKVYFATINVSEKLKQSEPKHPKISEQLHQFKIQ